MWIALRLRSGAALRAVGVRSRVLRTPAGAGGLAVGALIALVAAAGARTRWTDLALFLHSTPSTSTGVREPLYGLDVSFYLLTLPFLHDLVGWALGLCLAVGLLDDVIPVYHRRARGRRQQRHQHADQGRLAGAIRTEQAENLTVFDGETDAVHGGEVAELLHDLVDVYRIHRR